jgi:phosphate starvation-inducible PhoH-like protein
MSRQDFQLEPEDAARLARVLGPLDEHLRRIEQRLDVQVGNRGQRFVIDGEHAAQAAGLLHELWDEAADSTPDARHVDVLIGALEHLPATQGEASDADLPAISIRTRRGNVRGRSPRQQAYLHAITRHDISFGIGPAGTGKTFLAVAMAVEALNQARVQRLLLVRPAVEAGEKLGFLPGDLAQKVDPYLRPLYDALFEMMGVEKVQKLVERGVIEIAPLAYMRGRTLNDAFVILDEAQNTTVEQMKMFLTRLGFGATAVVTGDLSQVDLPKHVKSGLRDAVEVLANVEGVTMTFFEAADVVRHPLVARIVNAYDARDARDTRDAGSGKV